jgi:hypothetical protein
MLSGSMDHLMSVLQDAVVCGQFLQMSEERQLRCGVLVVLDMVHVLAIGAKHIVVLRVDTIILKLLMFKQVGHILFALLAFILVVIENVLDAQVVLPMQMDVT